MKKSKFILALVLALMLCLLIVPSAFAEGTEPSDNPSLEGSNPPAGGPPAGDPLAGDEPQGEIQQITEVGTVTKDTITVENATLDWHPADTSIGRYQEGWWVGVKIVAPDSVTEDNVGDVHYSNDGTDNLSGEFEKSKDGIEDGRYYMGCWVPVQQEYLEGALNADANLAWTYKFDWTGDQAVDQTFQIVVDPSNITLNKDNQIYCQTVDGKFTYRNGMSVQGGEIQPITEGGTVSGNTITVENASLDWYAADPKVGRYQDGWWVGVNIVAPSSVTDSNVNAVKYSNNGSSTLNGDFGKSNDGKLADGRYRMGCWLPVSQEYLENALNANANLTWTYKFGWADGKYVDQTFQIYVDPSNITLNKDGEIFCQTVNGSFTYRDGALVPVDVVVPDAPETVVSPTNEIVASTEEDVTSYSIASEETFTIKLAYTAPEMAGQAVEVIQVIVGGVSVDFEIAEDGSLVLPAEVLAALGVGTHTITIVTTKGLVTFTITITE